MANLGDILGMFEDVGAEIEKLHVALRNLRLGQLQYVEDKLSNLTNNNWTEGVATTMLRRCAEIREAMDEVLDLVEENINDAVAAQERLKNI
jgi:hypothetical protein